MVSVKVTTAIKLTTSQVANIEKAVAKKHTASDIEFEYIVDPQVIGGIKLMIGSTELDSTLQSKLQAVKQQLLTNL